jgi:hypothetical protein
MPFIPFRHIGAGVLAAFLSFGAMNVATQAADAPNKRQALEEAVRAFDEMAMRVNGGRATELARWTGPIYLAIADTPGIDRVAADVETLVRNLASVAKVSVERVSVNDPRRNFFVRASTRGSNGSTPCQSAVDWDDRGRMVAVEVQLNLNNLGRLLRCANHEVVHGFGLRAHPDQAFSVLSYKYSDQVHLTDTDQIVLQTLYDARVPVTGSMETVARVACEVMAEKLQMAPETAAPVCAQRTAPARRGLFASVGGNRGQGENIGQ